MVTFWFAFSVQSYFPDVNLKEEEKVYAAMRGIRGKGKARHSRRADNIQAKLRRKAAFEALRDKEILAKHRARPLPAEGGAEGGAEGDEDAGADEDEGSAGANSAGGSGGTINATLAK